MKKAAGFGSWPSAVTAELMCSASIGLSQARLFDGDVYWLESRPQEQGRNVIVRQSVASFIDAGKQPAGADRIEITLKDYNCRTRVHEYGGASFLPTTEGVFFVNQQDQQVYRELDGRVSQITDQQDTRFADFSYCHQRNMLVAIAERHGDDLTEPVNSLVSIDISNGRVHTLDSGQDFYASASFSPDGSKLCWISWMHPNMPWDGTSLWTATIDNNMGLSAVEHVAGGESESIFQPEWSPAGELFFVSDKSDWWNIYRLSDDGATCVCALDAEFGMPQWVFGMRRYSFVDPDTIVTSYSQSGSERLATIDTASGQITNIARPHSSYQSVFSDGQFVCYIAQSPASFPCLYVSAVDKLADDDVPVCKSSSIDIDPGHFSNGVPITYPTANDAVAHGFYYPPCHTEFEGLAGELPPLIVMIHGGPTSSTQNDLSLKIQFWTNRGFAVFDVNYRGSTGFGRGYRDALKGQWGVADVEDCDFGVRYLVQHKLADKDRVAIRGGSAGGFTTLAALALTDTFKAGASLYGVTDLTALATDTHKFESRYLDSLIGAFPEQKALYESRSPVNHADSINCPVIFLQGLDDKVVPPSQAQMMIDVLLKKGLKVAYLPFEGEAHGFRQSETIIKAFAAELWFYGEVLGFETAAVDGVGFIQTA